ncbi:LolA family protein [Thermoanaerobacter thermocopriae]|uniref:LolA family protein n=1 Tax=Thermoanaerobacter thermocopriae TaxID=29350 RepID=UPI0006D1B6BF|nr:outer membrane lipoprotein carrier protein LolA [Thermoanaerobacter thermocopriae]
MVEKSFFVIAFVIIFFLSGCGTKAKKVKDPFVYIKEQLNKLESYTATANVELYNNKIESKYTVMQFYKKGKLRLEVLDESGNIDKIIVYDGKRSYVYFARVNQVFVAENTQEIPLYSMITSFIKNYNSGGEIEKGEIDKFYLITVPILDKNVFMYKEQMAFSKKNLIPEELTIFDINNNIFSRITYKDFKYNPEIDDKLFTKDSVTTLAANFLDSSAIEIDVKEVYKYCGLNPVMPVYLPQGFKLLNVLVNVNENNGVIFVYTSGKNLIEIFETVVDKSEITNEKGFFLKEGVYYKEKDNGKKEYTTMVNGLQIGITVTGDVDGEEILKVIKSLR